MLIKEQGNLITFEGIDGSGKTTQLQILQQRFNNRNDIIFTREPGGTELASQIREVIMSNSMHKMTEFLLIYAARNELIQDILKPAISERKTVFCDRYIDSTTVYQGIKNNISNKIISDFNKIIIGSIIPDYTFLFDLPFELARDRKEEQFKETGKSTRFDFDQQSILRAGYLKTAKENSNRIIVIDATQERNKIAQTIYNKLIELHIIKG